jgi:hypothetical protein
VSDKVKFKDYDYVEPLCSKVIKFLASKGYGASNFDEDRDVCYQNEYFLDHPGKTAFGILYKDPDVGPETFFFGLLKKEPRKVVLGVIWFDNNKWNPAGYQRGFDARWIFHLYGRKNIELATQLAEEMASHFDISVTLELQCEGARFEISNTEHATLVDLKCSFSV